MNMNAKTKPADFPNGQHPVQNEGLTQDKVTDRYLIWMLGQILRPYLGQLITVVAMLLAVTGLSLLLPYLIQRAVDGPIANRNIAELWPIGLAYFGVMIALFVVRFTQTYLLQTVGQNALVSLRQRLFEHIMRQDMRYFNKTPVGQLVARIANDIDALTELLSTSIVIVFSNMITLVGIIAVMFIINWRLALLSLAVMPPMTIATVYYRKKIREQSSKFHKIVGEYLAFLNEQFGGMLIVQLFGRQHISRADFDDINVRYRDVHMHLRDYYTAYSNILQILTTLGLSMVLYGGGSGVLAGWATLGMLIAFIEYTRRSFEPILQLSEQFAQIQTALSAGERVAQMLRVEPEILPPQNPVKIADFKRSFTFDHVNFGYDEGNLVLRDVHFHVPPGQSVAIVGATGAGKTSLAGLLARFYDVTDGRVLIDDVDVRDMALEDLRKCVNVVPQNPYCFNGTIADNLRLFDETVTYEQMLEAAQMASAAPFIERLPGRYDFELLPGGANLSQGQRQLLALARALIHSANSILVLDEATSNIDTETEVYIQEGLKRVLRNRTSLVIAHRLSTIREVDRILVMQRGRVVEDGTHDALLRLNGLYTKLYLRQFAEVGQETPEMRQFAPK
jgi:ATP-binding cassette subfamily B protein